MKPLRFFPLIALGALLLFASCDKDDVVSTETALQRLQNRWKIDNIKTVYFTSPASATINYAGQPSDYYDFRANGKLYTSVNGSLDTLDYDLLNPTTLVVNNNGSIDTGRITTLTNSKLIGVTRFKINATEYSEVTAELSR